MSGGHLVVLDRAGREVKQYDLSSGSAILGSDSSCDIRIMLPTVRPHHATVLVHANQSVIRNVGSGETLLNGVSVSVAALRQDDVVSLGGRELRWRYANPGPHHSRRRPEPPALQSSRGSRASRGARGRRSDGAGLRPPHNSHRDSAPAAINTRQVAIVQPQRRDTADHIESLSNSAVSVVTNMRRRTVKSDSEMETSLNKSIEEMNKSKSPRSPINLQNTTKATLWIESRKSSPRKSLQVIPARVLITPKKAFSAKKSTPLRMAVLKKAQSAQKMRVTKIQAPLTIDHTKQAAIMLMTGHTPKQKTPAKKASLVVTKRPRGRASKSSLSRTSIRSSGSDTSLRSASKASLEQSLSVMEVSDSEAGQSTMIESDLSQPSERLSRSHLRSPTASPIKSALKDPRKTTRKTESIKFDLSNLDEPPSSPDDTPLRYSESPSPQPISSRARDILRRTLGSDENIASNTTSKVPSGSPSSPRLARGSLMVQRALRSASPSQMESYSIVDLVSADSNSSLYGSASDNSTYTSPSTSGRATRTRSLISSTPAVTKMPRSRSLITTTSYDSIRDDSQITYYSDVSTRSKSITTPVDAQNSTYNVTKNKHESPYTENVGNTFNVSRRSRQSLATPDITKENVTDNKSLSTVENTSATLNISTKSKRANSTLKAEINIENITINSTRSQNRSQMSESSMRSTRNKSNSESPNYDGTSTPQNQQSPEDAGTPVLSIQSLLDSDQNATLPRRSNKDNKTKILKRKTIGGLSQPKKRGSVKSKSLRISTRKSLRSRGSNISPVSSDLTEDVSQDDGDTTPKSAVKLVQEAVKNKHSTAKKPKSKRSIIDNLNDSDIVKQLFNSPVKRKLSQSMMEFSRKQHLNDDMAPRTRATRKTIAFGDKTPDNSVLEQTQAITPEIFVSPLSTPGNSPNLFGVKRLFGKNTPENDLRRVSGVKSLFQTEKKNKSPKNDLSDVANVRNLYKRNSPRNDLSKVSGVKAVMRRNSPRNDLRDVRGVRKLFHLEKKQDNLNDISGIEELFSESHQTSNVTDPDSENLFNLLIGKPAVRSYGSKAKSFSLKTIQKPKHTRAKSLETSFSSISNNVENWLENELRKRMHKDDENTPSTKKSPNKPNEEDMFDSSSKSNKSSSVISRSMSRSKHILELTMSGRKGKKSVINNSNVTVEGNKSKMNTSNTSVNKSKTKGDSSRNNLSRSRNETANNTSDFIGGDDEISIGNVTQFNASNKSQTNRMSLRKSISRSQNNTHDNSSDIIVGEDQVSQGNESQFDASGTSVDKSKTPKELTLLNSMNKSRNKSAINNSIINLEDEQIPKENESQLETSNKSVNKSKAQNEATPRRSMNRSRNETGFNNSNIILEDEQIPKENESQLETSSKSVNKSKAQNEATPRRSMNRSVNKTGINNSNIILEDDQILKENETQLDISNKSVNKSKAQNEATPRRSMNRSRDKTGLNNSNIHLEDDQIPKENETQLNISNKSVNKPKAQNEATPRKSMNRSRNKTDINNSNIILEDHQILKENETQLETSNKSVNKSTAQNEATPIKSMNRSRNKTGINSSNIHLEDNQIPKENETQFDTSNKSVNKSKAQNEATPRKSMNRSRNKTGINNSNIILEDDQILKENETQLETSNKSVNRSTPQNEATPRKSMNRSRNKTGINNSNIHLEGDEIPEENETQLETSNKSVNISKAPNEATPRKSLNRSRNKTAVSNSNIHLEDGQIYKGNESQMNASSTSVDKSIIPKESTLRKSRNRSRNKTAINNSNIDLDDEQISKENETQFIASNNSVKSITHKELTPRKSMNRSRNKSAINSEEDDEISKGNETQLETSTNKSINKSKLQNELTPRKSMNKSRNKTVINTSNINVEDNQLSQENETLGTSNKSIEKSKSQNDVTPRKSLKNKTASDIVDDISSNQKMQSVETPVKSISKSKNKTNRSRELLNLATDTVGGNTPLLTTRARNSTLTKTASDEGERKKSTSEIYSAHTLPLKKRSLADRDTSGNRSEKSALNILPIKKRAVVHSTPVKGRLNLTMNASDIGRVSPIAPVAEETIDADANPITKYNEVTKISPRRKLLQARSSKICPVAVSGKEKMSPAPVRATRRKTKESLDVNKVKKRKSSVVITKKTPAFSPKGPTNVSTDVPLVTEDAEHLKKTRGRKVTENTLQVDTEKNVTISKNKRKATLEIPNQKVGNESPKTKPGRKTYVGKDKETSISQQPPEESVPQPKKTRGQKVVAEKVATPKKLTRNKVSEVDVAHTKQLEIDVESNAKPRRGRKAEDNKVETKELQTGKRSIRGAQQKNTKENGGKKSKTAVSKNTGKKDNSKIKDSGSSENISRGRKRKITDDVSPPNVKKSKTDEIISKKNYKTEKIPTETKQNTRGRQKNLEKSENVEILKESRTRKGRVDETDTTEISNKKGSGKKAESRTNLTETTVVSKKTAGKMKESDKVHNEAEVKESRTRRGRVGETETTEISNKKVSGKKAENKTNQTETTEVIQKTAGKKKESNKVNNEAEVKESRTRRGRVDETETTEVITKTAGKKKESNKVNNEAEVKESRTRRGRVDETETTEVITKTAGKKKESNEVNNEAEVKETRTRRGRADESERTETSNKKLSGKKAESNTKQTETTEASKKITGKNKESDKVNEAEIRTVRGRRKQPETAEIGSKQNATEAKRTRRGEGDAVQVNEETKLDNEVKTRRQTAKELEKNGVKGKSQQKMNEAEKTKAKGKSPQNLNEPEKTEAKGKSGKKASEVKKTEVQAISQKAESKSSKQKVSEPEKAEVKSTRRQVRTEPELEKTEVRTTRRQKVTTEPEKPVAGRKRKNDADGSTANEAPQPSKTRKTQPVSPKAKRTRNAKVEEQKPATRGRRR